MIARNGARRILTYSLLGWGLFSASTGLASSAASLCVLRHVEGHACLSSRESHREVARLQDKALKYVTLDCRLCLGITESGYYPGE